MTLTAALPARTVRGTRILSTRAPGMRWTLAEEASVRPFRRSFATPSQWCVTLSRTLTTRTPSTFATVTRVIDAGAVSVTAAASAVAVESEAPAVAGRANRATTTVRMRSVLRIKT